MFLFTLRLSSLFLRSALILFPYTTLFRSVNSPFARSFFSAFEEKDAIMLYLICQRYRKSRNRAIRCGSSEIGRASCRESAQLWGRGGRFEWKEVKQQWDRIHNKHGKDSWM